MLCVSKILNQLVNMEYKNIYLKGYHLNKETNRPVAINSITVSFEEFINGMGYVHTIDKIRTLEYHCDEYNEAKRELPLVWIGATSNSGKRKKDDITTIYNIFSIDIDKQDNEELFEKYGIDELKEFLFYNTPGCFYAGLSVGGRGIVLYVKLHDVNIYNEKDYFAYYERKFNKAGIVIDKQTKDILVRARYPSYDANCYKQPYDDVEGFKLPDNIVKENKENIVHKDVVVNINNIDDIKYFNSTRRYKLCYTLKTVYNKTDAYNIATQIYDKFYNGTSNRIEAYNHIKASCDNNTKYVDVEIATELYLLGIDGFEKYKPDNTIRLKDNEYLSDVKDILIDRFKFGFNLLIAGTGVGKTELWKNIAKDGKSLLIVEPLNSIVNNKYDDTWHKAAGIGNYIDNDYEAELTNYDKFNSAKDTLRHYDYIVIDESHMIGTSDFRAKTLIPFIENIKMYANNNKDTKIILQTATPSNEHYFFNIDETVKVHKDIKKFVQIHYTNNLIYKSNNNNIEEYEHNISRTILKYVRIYLNEHRKVFIYWGKGSIEQMKLYQEVEDMLEDYKVAIYHKQNLGNKDLEYINDNKMIGDYDVLMSSCYFGVGCDLNDECPAAVIIVGNNTYQEDEQAIGRFRKSKNIKVNILVNSLVFKKYDVSEYLNAQNKISELVNNTKEFRTKSLIKRSTSEDINYMKFSNMYFSDIKRKFDFFKDRKYNLVNNYSLEYNNETKSFEYTIEEPTVDGNMAVIYLIDDKEDMINIVAKNRKRYVEELKEKVYNELINDETIDLEMLLPKYNDRPSYKHWLEGLLSIQHHYNLKSFLTNVSKKTVMSITKDKLKPIMRFKIMIDNNEVDNVELEILDKLYNVDEDDLDTYLCFYYCFWCEYAENNADYNYDMYNYERLNYPVYKEWKTRMLEIIKTNKEIRDYFINYHDDIKIGYETLLFFGMQEDEKEIPLNILRNHFINKSIYMNFINYILKNKNYITNNENGKKGGKKGKEIEIDGIKYSTVKAAAEALNISRQALYKRMNK